MREWLSVAVWVAAFLLFELPSKDVGGIWPWYSLSRTVATGEAWWWPLGIYVAVFMAVLLGHFELDWSARWVVVVAVIGVAMIVSRLVQEYVL